MPNPKTLQVLLFALAVALRSSFALDDPTDFHVSCQRFHALDDPTEVRPGDIDYTTQSFTRVADGVFYARAYDTFSDQVIVEGEDGIILLDTAGGSFAIEKVMNQVREKIPDKPLKAVIITHFHADHTGGLQWLMENFADPQNLPEIYAHRLIEQELAKSFLTTDGSIHRTTRQFGLALPPSITSSFPGPKLNISGNNSSYVFGQITRWVDDKLSVKIAGVRFELLHVPCETLDHLAVWIPDKKTAYAADLVYASFPNIFTIRGGSRRSSYDWYKSVDRVRYLCADLLLTAHMPPICGATKVNTYLTNYRDAIQFVNDQTFRLYNRRFTANEVARKIKLPSNLAQLPYLEEFYGKVEWSVRNVHANFSGWFSGEPQELFPLTESERAQKLKELLNDGSDSSPIDRMIASSKKNVAASVANFNQTGEYLYVETQWGLEIAQLALLAAESESPEAQQAALAKSAALNVMSRWVSSINAKYYYLTTSVETLTNDLRFVLPYGQNKEALVYSLPIGDVLSLYPVAVDSEKCEPEIVNKIFFYFYDEGKAYSYVLRNCILEFVVIDYSEDNSFHFDYWSKIINMFKSTNPSSGEVLFDFVIGKSQGWRDVLNQTVSVREAVAADDLFVAGGYSSLEALSASLISDWTFTV